jgi:ATP-binding cassette subfamily B protein
VFSILPAAVEMVVMSCILIALGHHMFLAIIGFAVACYVAIFSWGARAIACSARGAASAHTAATAVLTDNLMNYEALKCLNAENVAQSQVDVALIATERHWNEYHKRKLFNGILLATIFGLSLTATLFSATTAVFGGRMSIGEFVLIHTYLLQLIRPVEVLGLAFRDFAHALAFVEGMSDILNETPEDLGHTKQEVRPGHGEVLFDCVSFAYRPGKPVLSNVSFRLPAKGKVAIVGKSGAGKSSLVRVLLRLCNLDGGQILLDGTSISSLTLAELRGAIAVVHQDILLFNESIAFNIGIGRSGSNMSDIVKAARTACLHEFISGQPHGYATKVGERGIALSGGERQRVSIARAVLRDPKILIFDEATSSLDAVTEQEIIRNINKLSRYTTTLVIAHRLSSVIDADEIVVLDQGRVVECDTHVALLQLGGIYSSMWMAQQQESCYRH